MSLSEEDLPGYLYDAVRSARERGLRQMRVHLVGTSDPQWQISSRFAQSSGFHIAMDGDLTVALLQALNPPTGQTPVEAPARREHDLWSDADENPPHSICDRNGAVALGLCKVCHRGEIELEADGGECPGRPACDEPAPIGLFD